MSASNLWAARMVEGARLRRFAAAAGLAAALASLQCRQGPGAPPADLRGRVVVYDSGQATLTSYEVQDDGALRQVATAGPLQGWPQGGIALSPDGSTAYVAAHNLVRRLQASRGGASWTEEQKPVRVGEVHRLVVHPDGGLIVRTTAWGNASNVVAVHTLDASGQIGAELASVKTRDALDRTLLAPADHLLLVLARGQIVRAFRADSGPDALAELPGSPQNLDSAGRCRDMVFDPAARFLYVGRRGDIAAVSAYRVTTDPFRLTEVAGSPFHVGGGDPGLALHPDGTLLAVTNSATNDISVFRVDPTTGSLWPVHGSPFQTEADPRVPLIETSGRFLYLSTRHGQHGAAFRIDSGSGALEPLAVTVPSLPTDPADVAVTPPRLPIVRLASFVVPDQGEPSASVSALHAVGAQLQTVPDALARLSDQDYWIRRTAVKVLRRIRMRDSERPIVAAALSDRLRNDDSAAVRVAVLDVLAHLGPEAAPTVIPVLCDRLRKDEDREVREAILRAIEGYGPLATGAVPELIGALGDPRFADMRVAVIRAVGAIGPASRPAVPTLSQLSRSQNREIRRASVQALGRVGPLPEAALRALVDRALTNEPGSSDQAFDILRRHGGPPVSALQTLVAGLRSGASLAPRARARAAALLGDLGPRGGPAVLALAEALEDPQAVVRRTAFGALVRIRGEVSRCREASAPAATE